MVYNTIIKLNINPIAPNKGISNKSGPLSIVITKEEPIINAEANRNNTILFVILSILSTSILNINSHGS